MISKLALLLSLPVVMSRTWNLVFLSLIPYQLQLLETKLIGLHNCFTSYIITLGSWLREVSVV